MRKLSTIELKKRRRKKKETTKNEIVVQHNNLCEARYRLTLQEKRVVSWLASQIQRNDEDLKTHRASIQEFCQVVQVDQSNMYREIKKITMKLIERGLTIRNLDDGSLKQVNWLSLADYHDKEGYVDLAFNPYLKPFLLDLKEQYTQITLSDIMQLKSIYAIRIYELLKQYESIGQREISVVDLREYCGIAQVEYKRYNDFKKDVIETAFREIYKKTDLTFEIEEVKQSRRVVAIIFYICANPSYKSQAGEASKSEENLSQELNQRKDYIKNLVEYGFSRKTSENMASDLTDSELGQALTAVKNQVQQGKVLNPKAMIRTALKEKWKPDVFQTGKKR